MKLSNTQAALAKISERNKLITQLASISYKDARIIIQPAHDYGPIDVTSLLDGEAIRKTLCETYQKRINEIGMELKELGVYVDTDKAISTGLW